MGKLTSILVLVIGLIPVAILFQNCGGPFQPGALQNNLTNTGDGPSEDPPAEGIRDPLPKALDCKDPHVRCVPSEYSSIQSCADAAQPGNVCLVSEGNYPERVTVSSSGEPGKRITFKGSSAGAKPTMRGFEMSNKDYVTIDGFKMSGNIKCFKSSGGNTCNWIQLLNNDIEGINIGIQMRANDVLISGNTFDRILGDMVRQHGYRWVIRDNTVIGEEDINDGHMDFWQSFCGGGNGDDGIGASFALLENNTYVDIVGRNVHFSLVNGTNGCGDAPTNLINRFNKIRDIGSGAMNVDTNQQAGGARNNMIYNNTYFNLSGGSFPSWNDYAPGNYTGSVDSSALNNLLYNAMDNVGASGFIATDGWYQGFNLYYDPDDAMTFSRGAANETGAVKNKNPLFNNLKGTDFSLNSDSPAIDAGGHLTNLSSADTGTGEVLAVDQAAFFQPGWGGSIGDCLAIGTVNNTACISSIDYGKNTITLSTSVNRSPADRVWLFKDSAGRTVLKGKAPDIGAVEH